MAERIVSPGVFTRERDLSFLPVGIGEIGAAIVGPTLKGPSFVPTVVRSFQEFETIFGSYSEDYYTSFTVREYLRSAGSVTIVKVGAIGGYSAGSVNLVVSGSNPTAAAASFPDTVVATFAPSALNNSGLGSISGSVGGALTANSFTLNIAGTNATASLTEQSIIEGGTGALFSDAVGSEPLQPSIGSTAAPAYLYKHFKSSISASKANGYIAGASSVVSLELQSSGLDFGGGSTSVNETTYETTINGNKDSQAARTPYIQSQKVGGSVTNLFRVYQRVDGAASNLAYVVVRDIKRPQNSNSSADFAQFTLALHDPGTGDALESYNNLNLDPASPNFVAKVIGDQFQTVTEAGEVVTHGEYANRSERIRIGDYDEKTFSGAPALQPMGFAAVLEPIVATAAVPTGSFNHEQIGKVANAYNEAVPYGWKISPKYHELEELDTNLEYHSAIPNGANSGNNVAFSLEDMQGFGLDGSIEDQEFTNFVTRGAVADTPNGATLTISSSQQQLIFAVPFQQGFDGENPSIEPKTGGDITAGNVMGFDCSTSTSSGSVAYKRAIDTVSNPDEIDINMLVTPGVIHSLHPVVTNHAMDKVEARADCFYVMDTAAWGDNVATAVDNVKTLDTNFVATYYPWVKIDNPDTGKGIWVPPSVLIPGVIAFTDSVAHEWFAPAGLNRGGLSSARIAKKKLTHTDRDTLYEARINPIATFPGQGVVVFGQKTLQAKPSALDRINVRRLLIRLKKFIASSSRFLVFEQNDSSTRARFLNIVNPFLESVQANSGLSAFRVVMDDSNNTPDVIDRNQLVGQIFIQPTRTAEFIVLDFTVLPTGAAFPE